jgi:uncharacterized protein YggE
MLNPSMYSTAVNIMTLTGNGEVKTIPDVAILRLGVQTTGEQLTDIQSENARISQTILKALEQLNITDIKTYQYTIDKRYEYEDGKQIDKGYAVRNIFEIRTSNLDQVGNVIDTAVHYGANVVDLIEFEVSDINTYYFQALDLAIENAYQKAMMIAGSLGITNAPVPIRINESSTVPMPYLNLVSRESAVSTPIEAGSKQIKASVVMKFLY